jgi:tetratricopeptide (TPR) repeat protein
MAISKSWPILLMLSAGSAWSRDAATPSECQVLASQPALSSALAKVARHSDDLRAQVALADAWSDAGCYNEAVVVLQNAVNAQPGVIELQTRLRVAKSLVGEEHFFDDLDRVDRQARVKRDAFRCSNLEDLDACNEAARLQPDDPAPLTALGDALMRAKRPSEALQHYRRAETLASDNQALAEKIRVAETELSAAPTLAAGSSELANTRIARAAARAAPRRYSNVSPDGQSH